MKSRLLKEGLILCVICQTLFLAGCIDTSEDNYPTINLNEPVTISGSILFTATNVTISDDLLWYPPESGFTFVQINVTLNNTGNKPNSLGCEPGHLKADGKKFSYENIGGKFTQSLQPGEVAESYVIYNMKEDLTPIEFSLEDHSQSTVVVIKL